MPKAYAHKAYLNKGKVSLHKKILNPEMRSTDKKHILICSSGNVHQLLIYAKSFSKLGFDVTFLNPAWTNRAYKWDEQLDKYGIKFLTYANFYKIMGKNIYDVIFSCNHTAVIHARRIKERLDIPALQQILDIPTAFFDWPVIGGKYRRKHKPFIKNYPKMNMLTGINIEVPRQVRELCNRDDCHYIPYPIDTDLYDLDLKYNTPRHNCVFCISRMEPYKGVHLLIEACRNLGLDLMLAGGGTEKENYERFAKKIGGNYSFLGSIDDKEKYYWMKSSRIVVYPQTWNEGPGIVSQEALYCKVLPVCFGYPSQKKLDNNYGIYADLPPTVKSLEKAIGKAWELSADEKVRKILKDGHEYVKNNLSGDVISKRILELLKKLYNGN